VPTPSPDSGPEATPSAIPQPEYVPGYH